MFENDENNSNNNTYNEKVNYEDINNQNSNNGNGNYENQNNQDLNYENGNYDNQNVYDGNYENQNNQNVSNGNCQNFNNQNSDNGAGGYQSNHPNYNNQPNKKPCKSGKGKKTAKFLGAVAGVVIIAFGGGTIGGYLANRTGGSISGINKVVDSTSYSAPEFLSSSDGSLTVSEAFEKVKPAVVTISTTSIQSGKGMFSQQVEGIGSGFIINEEGYILTNYHVVEGSNDVTVILSTGEEVSATVVNYDEKKDIAMVKLAEGTKVPAVAELGDSDAAYPGEDVLAIGTPLSKSFASTLTKGIVSAVGRDVETSTGITMSLIQTDTAINPGNSGGPLINTKGQVIGINSMKLVTTDVEGIGFAIPINEAKDRIETLSKPIITLGVEIVDITTDLAKQNNLPEGIYINDVTQFSPAAKAGIKIADVITSFDGTRVKTADELSEAKNKKEKGDTVEVIVVRNDKEVTLTMTLE